MLNLTQAIEHGKRVGVRFYVMNDANCVMGRYPNSGTGRGHEASL